MAAGAMLIAAALQLAAPIPPAEPWRTAPVAAGNWAWRPLPGGSEASFAGATGTELTLRCTRATRTIQIIRGGVAGGAVVRTTSIERTLPDSATLGARDPLLDAIAFTRGRFSVEMPGLPRLIVPGWPEPARAIEDCRN